MRISDWSSDVCSSDLTYGHQVGDQVLRRIGAVISSSFRATDIHGRLGGEEFAILLPDTSIEVATQIAEQLIDTIAGLMIEPVHRISASLGDTSTAACSKIGSAAWRERVCQEG